ncbi:MAG: hypothetical protein LBT27_04940 [Prevotellaceae bacterium]|jgi:hypothetical protein|nr:hypothetical protein [Prevotellaceae bacterium]
MPTFTAHRLSSDNTLYPDRIEIDATNVIYYKGYVFGYQSTVIARSNVASVSVGSGIFFADVVIESYGGKRIEASGFKKSDAKAIVNLLT